jgi:hypothetical protein
MCLGKSVKSCIDFSSRCFYFLFVEFDSASNWACIHIACASSLFAVGWWVCLKAKGWLCLVDAWADGDGVINVLVHRDGVINVLVHFFMRCSCGFVNVACVCARVVRVRVVCCR